MYYCVVSNTSQEIISLHISTKYAESISLHPNIINLNVVCQITTTIQYLDSFRFIYFDKHLISFKRMTRLKKKSFWIRNSNTPFVIYTAEANIYINKLKGRHNDDILYTKKRVGIYNIHYHLGGFLKLPIQVSNDISMLRIPWKREG